ncbi:MAG: toll/interleukin-1 receptor domain-containing protein [Chloroflexi bacterium]|nr:toll/interleukin-1 receptor domain-containing protein [Chloroflexota bacterium]
MASKSGIFLSYTSSQKHWADWVQNELLSVDFDVEMDSENWRMGETITQKINDALLRHSIFLPLWSKDYFDSRHWTNDEINAAYNLHRKNYLKIVPFYIEPEFTAPPLYQSLISSSLFGLTENAARHELRLKLQPYADKPLRTMPLPTKHVQFPRPLGTSLPFITTGHHNKSELLEAASNQAGKVLLPQIHGVPNVYALEDIAKQLSLLSRSYNSEPPLAILEKVLHLWRDLDLAEEIAKNNPAQLIDIYVMKSRAFGIQSYATMDLGDSKTAFSSAIAMKAYSDKAGHSDLTAWAIGTQAMINRFDKQDRKALEIAAEGFKSSVSGIALARLHCQAALSWAELGDFQKTMSSLTESENLVGTRPSNLNESDGIFFFSPAKYHYYAGNSLMRFAPDYANHAEQETRLALKMFEEGDEDTKSISDELIAAIHLATSIFHQGRIDEILDTLQPVLTASREFRTSWHLWWLQRLGYSLEKSEHFNSSEVTEKILNAIRGFEADTKTEKNHLNSNIYARLE